MRSSSPSVRTRGPPGAATALCDPAVREGADDRVGELALERRDLPAQLTRARRARRPMPRTSRTSSMRRESTGRPPGGRKRLRRSRTAPPRRGAPARPGPATANSRRRALSRAGRRLGRDLAEEHRDRAGGVGDDEPRPGTRSAAYSPSPSRSPAAAPRSPSGPSSRASSSAHTGTPVSTSATSSASSSGPREAKPPLHQPVERRRLDRRALRVGVEADVAEEDAVGVRDRLAAQRQRPGAVEAVGQQRQALAQHARRAPPAAPERRTRRAAARGTRARARGRPSPPRAPGPRRSWRRHPARLALERDEAPVEPGVVELADARAPAPRRRAARR